MAERYFSTMDIYMATFLKMRGFSFERAETSVKGKTKVMCVWPETDGLRAVIEEWFASPEREYAEQVKNNRRFVLEYKDRRDYGGHSVGDGRVERDVSGKNGKKSRGPFKPGR